MEENMSPIFKLADLANLYSSRMEQFEIAMERVHTTRLKQRLLAHFPDLQAHTKGRDVLLAFDKDIGCALAKSCEQDADTDAVHLARAAQIVRRQMFDDREPFSGSFKDGCQEESVPHLLLALVNMVLEGPNIKTQSQESTSQAALTISQLLKYNSLKHRRTSSDVKTSVRHNADIETPVPTYIGLMLHAQTRKRELIDKLHNLGISLSYDKVLRISTELGNKACRLFEMERLFVH